MLSRIKSVSYTLPFPLSSRPVRGASANRAFCYRQTGSLSLQDSPLGSSAPVLALAVVDLGGGKQFQISAPAGTAQPPDCPAHQAGSAGQSSATPASGQQPPPAQGQQQSPSPRQSSPSPTPTARLTQVPSVIGDTAVQAQQILNGQGFQVQMIFTPDPAANQPVTPGTVWSQNPAAQTSKPHGSIVQISVQTQPTSSPTPAPSQKSG